jgi:predicted oxidoreductase
MWQHFNVHSQHIYTNTDQNLVWLLLVDIDCVLIRPKHLWQDNLVDKCNKVKQISYFDFYGTNI